MTPAARTSVVLGSAALAVGSFAVFGLTGRAVVGALLGPVLVVLTAIDLRERRLPNAIVLPAALGMAAIVAVFEPHVFLEHLWAGLALFGFLFVFAAVFAGGLGMGDAKTGLLIGLALGSQTGAAMFVALFAVFLAAVWILVRNGMTARKQTIAFGPFLAFGAVLAFFLG